MIPLILRNDRRSRFAGSQWLSRSCAPLVSAVENNRPYCNEDGSKGIITGILLALHGSAARPPFFSLLLEIGFGITALLSPSPLPLQIFTYAISPYGRLASQAGRRARARYGNFFR